MTLLHKIETFCRKHHMAETSFGRDAVKDGSFVARLRNGRSPTMRTAEKVDAFIAKYEKPKRGNGEAPSYDSLG